MQLALARGVRTDGAHMQEGRRSSQNEAVLVSLVSTLRDAQAGDVYIYAYDERHTVSRKSPQYTNMTLVDGKKRVVRTGDIESSGFRRFVP